MDRKEPEERKQEIVLLDNIINSFGEESNNILEILPHLAKSIEVIENKNTDLQAKVTLKIFGYVLARLGVLFIGSNIFFAYFREMIEINSLHLTKKQFEELRSGMIKLEEEFKKREKGFNWVDNLLKFTPETEKGDEDSAKSFP